MHEGIFTVENTPGAVTPNVCTEARINVIGYNTPNAVDKAHTVVSQWSKATGIPVSCDTYFIVKTEDVDKENKKYTIQFECI